MKVKLTKEERQKFLNVAEAAKKNPNTAEDVLEAMNRKPTLTQRIMMLQWEIDEYMDKIRNKVNEI